MKTYKQIRLDINGFDKDILSAILFNRGALGIEEFSNNLWFIFMPSEFNLTDLGELSDYLKKVNHNFGLNQIVMTKLEERDWIAEWKNYFSPIKIGKKVWITPPWENVEILLSGDYSTSDSHGFGSKLLIDKANLLLAGQLQGISHKLSTETRIS